MSLSPSSYLLYKHLQQSQQPNFRCNGYQSKLIKTHGYGPFGFNRRKLDHCKKVVKKDCKVKASGDLSRPFVEMELITDGDHLNLVLEQAKQASQPIIIDWMATWCRKCIYLKPKLEKLAAEYDIKRLIRQPTYKTCDTKLKHQKVKRHISAHLLVQKMPTIQLWKDGEMKSEVIGGGKASLVIEEVRDMIQNFV